MPNDNVIEAFVLPFRTPSIMWRDNQVTVDRSEILSCIRLCICTGNRLWSILPQNKGPNSPRTKDHGSGKSSSSGSRIQSLHFLLGPHPVPHTACWGNYDLALINHFCHNMQGDHHLGFRSHVISSHTTLNILWTLLHVISFSNG